MDRTYRLRWGTLAVLCLSLLLIGLDNTVLNVALPTLQRDLDASASELQWIVDAYTLIFAGLLLTAGSWGDKYGRRRALALGLLVFSAAAAWGANCDSPRELIAARSVMGLGGALVMPSTLSILTNVFTDPAERKRAIGVWAGVSGIGIAIGPALGGWLLEHYAWSSVFWINVPVAGLALLLTPLLVRESRDPRAPRLDLGGATLSTAGLSLLVWAIIEAPDRGWGDRWVVGGFVVAAAVLALFALWERRVREPMLDVSFFHNPRFSVPAISVTLLFFALFGSVFFLSIHIQSVMGYSPLEAGLRILPIAASLAPSAPLAMLFAQRIGEKIPVVVGMTVIAGAFGLLSRTTVDSGYGHVLVFLLLLGFGIGFAMSPATEAVMGALPRAKAGVGSAVNDTTRQVGGALGVAVLGSILNSVYTGRMEEKVAGLPPAAAEAARDNLQAAVAVAGELPVPSVAQRLVTDAQEAFVHAMDVTVLIGAAVALLGAAVTLVWLPHHGEPGDDVPDEPVANGGRAEPDERLMGSRM
ncbi:MFS transporter [Carbonactinospora thermoautotrophica]|uniref:MFS transporter n=1 Tax=Carbonactinospora thermoautotrophica TaxID=1469144 RepID=UPI00226DCE47|nr:MFS transporter [Carbonactinospora thermoautotrophica]MCX9191776.1 MFS transporter [Carbonactinospora thermoautotrophica]